MILVLLPHCDYDPTESSVPWQYLHRAGIEVRFATPQVPGGHAEGMRSLLESSAAQQIALHFFKTDKPIASVCHGPLLFARTLIPIPHARYCSVARSPACCL